MEKVTLITSLKDQGPLNFWIQGLGAPIPCRCVGASFEGGAWKRHVSNRTLSRHIGPGSGDGLACLSPSVWECREGSSSSILMHPRANRPQVRGAGGREAEEKRIERANTIVGSTAQL